MTGRLGGRSNVAHEPEPFAVFPPLDVAVEVGDGATGLCFPATYTESFNKADGALGPDLPWWDGLSYPLDPAEVVSNAATHTSVPFHAGGVAVCQEDMLLDDKIMQVVVASWVNPTLSFTTEFFMAARFTQGPSPTGGGIAGNEFLRIFTDSSGVASWRISNFYQNPSSPLTTVTATRPSAGDVIEFAAVGDDLIASLNGVVQTSYTLSPGNSEVSHYVDFAMVKGNNLTGSISIDSMSVTTVCP